MFQFEHKAAQLLCFQSQLGGSKAVEFKLLNLSAGEPKLTSPAGRQSGSC